MDDKGTYLSIDNGHLNQKRQMYKQSPKRGVVQPSYSPGPGSYETNSSIVSKEFTRKLMLNRTSKHNLSTSPSNHAASLTTTGSALKRSV